LFFDVLKKLIDNEYAPWTWKTVPSSALGVRLFPCFIYLEVGKGGRDHGWRKP